MSRMFCRMKYSFGVLVLLSTPLVTAAQDQEYCLDRASEAAYEECMQMRFNHADGALNLLYQQALGMIEDLEGVSQEEVKPEAWKAALREAQRAWIAFKEAECDRLAPRENWTMWNEEHARMICRIHLTEARVRDLAAHYDLSENPTAGAYGDIIQAEVYGLERRTLERFGLAVERHDWEEVRSMFNEENYLEQRDGFGLEDDQIILETLGIEGNLASERDADEDDVYDARLSRIAEIIITKAAYDDSRMMTVEGSIILFDGSEHRFSMLWAERMNGGIEVVVPVG